MGRTSVCSSTTEEGNQCTPNESGKITIKKSFKFNSGGGKSLGWEKRRRTTKRWRRQLGRKAPAYRNDGMILGGGKEKEGGGAKEESLIRGRL